MLVNLLDLCLTDMQIKIAVKLIPLFVALLYFTNYLFFSSFKLFMLKDPEKCFSSFEIFAEKLAHKYLSYLLTSVLEATYPSI